MGPKGVAVDKNGHIITVDNKACCVFIFQSNGKLVTKFGGRGTSDRQFAGEVATAITFKYRQGAHQQCFLSMTVVEASLSTSFLK